MAQNELHEMISRYQKELLQYARSAKQPTASRSFMPNPSPSQSVTNKSTAPQPPTPPLDEIDSGYMPYEFDGFYGEEMGGIQADRDLDQIDGTTLDQIDGTTLDQIDAYLFDQRGSDFATDEELSGYFSAYPEDDPDQMPSPYTAFDTTQNPSAAQNPSADQIPSSYQSPAVAQTYSAPTVTSHTNSEAEATPQFVGYLEVTARTGDGAKPVEAALVIVSSTDEKGERLEFTALTDSSGTARLFNLPASNPANTESPDMPDRFILYNVSVSKPGYFDMVSTGVPLIGGITSRQDFRMIPLPEGVSSDTIEFDNTEPQDLN